MCTQTGKINASVNGTLVSPGYLGQYGNNRFCKLILEADEDYRLQLEFQYFHLQGDGSLCEFNYLQVSSQTSLPFGLFGICNIFVLFVMDLKLAS